MNTLEQLQREELDAVARVDALNARLAALQQQVPSIQARLLGWLMSAQPDETDRALTYIEANP